MLSSSKGLFFAENLNNFFRGYVVEFVWLNVRLVLATREKHDRAGQHFAVVVHSCMSRGLHFVRGLLRSVDLDNCSSALPFVVVVVFASKDDVNVSSDFHCTRGFKVGIELRPVLPVERQLCPSKLGELALALKLPPEHEELVPADQACVPVRRADERDVLDRVLHRQEPVPRLLDADVPPSLDSKVVVSQEEELFVEQARCLAKAGELRKCRDRHGALLRTREHFDLSLVREDQRCGRLTHESRRFEGFIVRVSL